MLSTEVVHSDLRGCGLDMDADKGFLEGDMPELRSERFVITKGEGEGRRVAERHSM